MEVDGPAIEQAADGAPAAAGALAAADPPQPISAAATAPGQFIACMSALLLVATDATSADELPCVRCVLLCR